MFGRFGVWSWRENPYGLQSVLCDYKRCAMSELVMANQDKDPRRLIEMGTRALHRCFSGSIFSSQMTVI